MLDIRIANQENEVAIVKPVAALSASRMKAALMAVHWLIAHSMFTAIYQEQKPVRAPT